MRRRRDSFPGKKGFTLLELLLVIVILSAGAWMLMSTTRDGLAQARYEDTRNRLGAIREAILGPGAATALERGLLAGYVVDNGVLPESINALVEPPTGYDLFGQVVPVFGPNTINRDGESGTKNLDDHPLMKGHRGAYLSAFNGKFRDGWGTKRSDESDTNPDDNHGWTVTPASDPANPRTSLEVGSYGMDGEETAEPADSPYEVDVFMSPSLDIHDWQMDVSGREVIVRNLTLNDIGDGAGGSGALNIKLRASLLIYRNSETGAIWRRETTEFGATGICLDGDGDGLVGGTHATREDVLRFASGTEIWVPAGEHVLVLVKDPEGDNDLTKLEPADLAAFLGKSISPHYIVKRVKFYPRATAPDMVLEIR